jgi:hypothetical protein
MIGYIEGPDALSNHDLSHLADWADREAKAVTNPAWKRAYALLREGSDLLLRRRAMSAVENCEIANDNPVPMRETPAQLRKTATRV